MEITEISREIPFFESQEKKQKLIFVIGALVSHLISLAKASEILEISRGSLIEILDMMNIQYSCLSLEDVEDERND